MTAKIEKVLLLDGVDSVCGEILQKAGIKVTVHAKLSKEQLAEELKVRSKKKTLGDNCKPLKNIVNFYVYSHC